MQTRKPRIGCRDNMCAAKCPLKYEKIGYGGNDRLRIW